MSRLSKYDRELMAKALVKHRFNDRANDLTSRSAGLFNEAIDEWHGAETVKLMRRLLKLHPTAFAKQDQAYIKARGMYCTVGSNRIGHSGCWWGADAKAIARPALASLDAMDLSQELRERIAEFALETKTFGDDVGAAYRKALGTLSQFTTAKRLEAEWPEAMPIIGKLIPQEDRSLPVVQLEAINDEFGLPPAEQIAA